MNLNLTTNVCIIQLLLKFRDTISPQYYIIKGTKTDEMKTVIVASYKEMREMTPRSHLQELYDLDVPSAFSEIFTAENTGKANLLDCQCCYFISLLIALCTQSVEFFRLKLSLVILMI